VAPKVLPGLFEQLRAAGVELAVDGRTRTIAGLDGDGLAEATEEDWDTEYLGMKMAVKIVDSLDEAIEHVNRHGTGHSEAIVTSDEAAAERFTGTVDAACVYVNASTRFTDGAEFGMGAEMGNSTQKLHARGPIALRELTTFKYVVHGTGQVRS
jgi:glutamate-5-semialdehyde dehydrogenase